MTCLVRGSRHGEGALAIIFGLCCVVDITVGIQKVPIWPRSFTGLYPSKITLMLIIF